MANGLRVMTDKTNIIHKKKMILLGFAVFIAYLCRMCDFEFEIFQLAGYLRTYIYITIFYLWGRSIKRRIIQKQVQHYKYSWTYDILDYDKNNIIFHYRQYKCVKVSVVYVLYTTFNHTIFRAFNSNVIR